LYAFGERSSGKSKWAESIMALFYIKRQAFNLNSGTDFAFFNYMQIFINCPAALNEADEKVLKPE
jgi:DNA primase